MLMYKSQIMIRNEQTKAGYEGSAQVGSSGPAPTV